MLVIFDRFRLKNIVGVFSLRQWMMNKISFTPADVFHAHNPLKAKPYFFPQALDFMLLQ